MHVVSMADTMTSWMPTAASSRPLELEFRSWKQSWGRLMPTLLG